MGNRGEKTLSHVVMIGNFLHDNKPKTSLEIWIRTVSNLANLIQFHLICQILAKFSGVESERTASKLRKRPCIFVLCSRTIKRAREIRKFHVAVEQCWLKNHGINIVCPKLLFCFINQFFFPVLVAFAVMVSSLWLSSRYFATMATWRHTFLYKGWWCKDETPCMEGMRIPESETFLFVESEIWESFACGTRNHGSLESQTDQGITIWIQNPSCSFKGWNPYIKV